MLTIQYMSKYSIIPAHASFTPLAIGYFSMNTKAPDTTPIYTLKGSETISKNLDLLF